VKDLQLTSRDLRKALKQTMLAVIHGKFDLQDQQHIDVGLLKLEIHEDWGTRWPHLLLCAGIAELLDAYSDFLSDVAHMIKETKSGVGIIESRTKRQKLHTIKLQGISVTFNSNLTQSAGRCRCTFTHKSRQRILAFLRK
jgi:hypothetical protein